MIVLNPTSKEYSINYPDHVSEFEVQSSLFHLLKSIDGIEVRAEVKSRGTFGLREAKSACRFDIVVYLDKKAICIIEVKGAKVRHKTVIEDTRQGIRYRAFGIPVVVCYGMDDVNDVHQYVHDLVYVIQA